MVNPPVKYRKSAIFLRHLSKMAGNTDMCPAKFITSQKNQPILVDGLNHEYRKKSKVGSTTYWQCRHKEVKFCNAVATTVSKDGEEFVKKTQVINIYLK